MSASPAWMCCPSCTLRSATYPETGATTALRCAAIHASRYASLACRTVGLLSTAVPSTSACADSDWRSACASAARAKLHTLLRVPHFFSGDGLIGHQRFAFCQVNLRAREFQLARFDFRIVLTRRGFLLTNLAHR